MTTATTSKPTKEQLRAAAPEMAEFVDELRNLFGVVKVVHVKAGPYEIGQPSEGTLIPWVIHETGAQIKQSLVEARKEWVKADKQFRKKPTQRVAGRAK